MDMLREAFPAKVDLDELVREISAFEGAWQYYYPLMNAFSLASPVFNDDGDLLFELRRHGTTSSRMHAAPGSVLGGRVSGRNSPAPRGRLGRPRSTPASPASSPGGYGQNSPTSGYPRSPPPTIGRPVHLNGENASIGDRQPRCVEAEPFIVQAPVPTQAASQAEFIPIINGKSKSTSNRAFNGSLT